MDSKHCFSNKSGIHLYEHQKRVVSKLMHTRGILAIHSTGSGKTLTAASCAKCLLSSKIVHQVIVLAKKSALSQFQAEVERFLGPSPALLCTTHQTFFSQHSEGIKNKVLLVVDEAHEFVVSSTTSFNNLQRFCRQPQCMRILMLTATPIVNSPYDLAPLTSILKNVGVPDRREFEKNVLDSPRGFRAWFEGVIDVHFVDKDRDSRYPKIASEKHVSIGMSPSTFARYKHLEKREHKPFYSHLRGTINNDACEKCAWLLKHIERWTAQGEGKVLVYTSFIDKGTRLLAHQLMQRGINTLVIEGDTNASKRHQSAVIFNKTSQQEQEEQSRHKNLSNLLDLPRENNNKQGVRCGEGNIEFYRDTVRGSSKWYSSKKTRVSNPSHDVANMKIPPAWSPAEVCRDRSKLMWVARDASGKWQYRYSDDWNTQQEYKRVTRLRGMDSKFWERFERKVQTDMKGTSWSSQQKRLALATGLLRTCHFRVGGKDDGDDGEDNEDDETHYGLMTILLNHIKGDTIGFIGKSGKLNTCTIKDRSQQTLVKSLANYERATKDPKLFGSDLTATHMREYLDSIRPGLRPKDFRTYFANYKLIDMLRADPHAIELRPNERKRRINEAIRDVAKGLNNTPEVAKRSYIFHGFVALYLVDPLRFMRVLANTNDNTADILDAFIKLFDEEAIDWKYMLQWFKETKGAANFMGVANVLLISDAGAESIDLKGTRHIVFVDPVWTPAMEDQIIGRGQRLNSHVDLPKNKQNLTIWKLFLDRPDGKPSADRILDGICREKRNVQKTIYKKLQLL